MHLKFYFTKSIPFSIIYPLKRTHAFSVAVAHDNVSVCVATQSQCKERKKAQMPISLNDPGLEHCHPKRNQYF